MASNSPHNQHHSDSPTSSFTSTPPSSTSSTITAPTSSAPPPPPSKLPKFLQNKAQRDRSRSMTLSVDSASTRSHSSGGGSPSPSTSPELSTGLAGVPPAKGGRKGSKLLDRITPRDKRRGTLDSVNGSAADLSGETPVIFEPTATPPAPTPRQRTRSERPVSSSPVLPSPSPSPHHSSHNSNSNSLSTSSPTHGSNSMYAPSSSTPSTSNLPTRLSGWFTHTFSSSSTDLSLPALLSSSSHSSQTPGRKSGAGVLLAAAAKHGKGHLDKAVRYLLDSDAVPDRCREVIWLMGVQHPGWEGEDAPDANNQHQQLHQSQNQHPHNHLSSSLPSPVLTRHHKDSSSNSHPSQDPSTAWPPAFYLDFTSRIWLTYRSQFSIPIKDIRLADLSALGYPNPSDYDLTSSTSSTSSHDPAALSVSSSPTTVRRGPWPWEREKAWTSDSGWGCMLRTGQSLLANALVGVHLGRDWRKPPQPVLTADYALYVQILTWFFDTPMPEAPFSVHRMALAGKEFGTDVGQWFGPSVAAGAIKTLVHAFPECGLGVATATDGALYQSDVFAASYSDAGMFSPKRHKPTTWGDRPVLLLLGIRLGIDGVNPIYYETIKQLYTFPQSIGIAGGRPSSSYYFVGSQADNLFYLDPHHARPAIPLRLPPPRRNISKSNRETTPESDREKDSLRKKGSQRSTGSRHSHHNRHPTSPSSGSSTLSYHAPVSPSPLQQQFSTDSNDSSLYSYSNTHSTSHSSYIPSKSPPGSVQNHQQMHSRFRSQHSQPSSPAVSSEMDYREIGVAKSTLDPVQEHYATAYSAAELKTFHCERVRKMPLSGLDPSMLIGFLCRDEADWWDFRRRVGKLPRTIFSVGDEPPNWVSDMDDDVGMESMSEPSDDLDIDMGEEEGKKGEQYFDTRSGSGSTSSRPEGSGGCKSENPDTEEDPTDPVTPGPHSRFEIVDPKSFEMGKELDFDPEDDEEPFDNDIEDDWVDPSLPTPSLTTPAPSEFPPPVPEKDSHSALTLADLSSWEKTKPGGSLKKVKKAKKQVAVPVPMVRIPSVAQQSQEHYPFPVTPADDHSHSPPEPSRDSSISNTGVGAKRMHTARARDGGRTQSGGVKGILPDE